MEKKIKPKFWIIGIAALLFIAVVLVALVFLVQPKIIGIFGLDRESENALQLQALLEDKGYTVVFADHLEDLGRTDCKAWIVHTKSDAFAAKILDTVGDKAIFIGHKPALSQPIRFVGLTAEASLSELFSRLPSQGDTNEDGTVTCLLLTAEETNWMGVSWEQPLYAGLAASELPTVVLDTISCPPTAVAGKKTVAAKLSDYGRDIEVILTSHEMLAQGAAQAIRENGWEVNEDFYLLTIGHTEQSITALNERQYSGLILYRQEDMEIFLLAAVADALAEKAPKDFSLPFRLYHNATPLQ